MELLYPYCKTGTHKKCFIGLAILEPIEIKKRRGKAAKEWLQTLIFWQITITNNSIAVLI